MRFHISHLGGMIPALADEDLPNNSASDCLNVVRDGNYLTPFGGINLNKSVYGEVDPAAAQKTIRFLPGFGSAAADAASAGAFFDVTDQNVVSRPDYGTIVKGPLANDAYSRWYSAGDEHEPYIHYKKDGTRYTRALGAPENPEAINGGSYFDQYNGEFILPTSMFYTDAGGTETAITAAEAGISTAELIFCSYAYTLESDIGEESELFVIDSVIERWDTDQTDYVEDGRYGYLAVEIFSRVFDDTDAEALNLYRTEGDGEYLFVARIAKDDFSSLPISTLPSDLNSDTALVGEMGTVRLFMDAVKSSGLGSANLSADFNRPDPAMNRMTTMGSGVIAGALGNVVCFSYPYYPHAWPIEYRYSLVDGDVGEMEIRAMVVMSGYLVVLTNSKIVLLYGSDPSQMDIQIINEVVPCTYPDSLVSFGSYCLFMSDKGIVRFSLDEGVSLATDRIMTELQWRDFVNSAQRFCAIEYKGQYMALEMLAMNEAGDSSLLRGMVFDTKNGIYPIEFETNSEQKLVGMFYDADANDTWIFGSFDFSGNVRQRIYLMGRGTLPGRWRSRIFELASRRSPSAAFIRSNATVEEVVVSGKRSDQSITEVLSLERLDSDIPTNKAFRIPAARVEGVWFEVVFWGGEGSRVESITLASTMKRLLA